MVVEDRHATSSGNGEGGLKRKKTQRGDVTEGSKCRETASTLRVGQKREIC